MFQCAVRNHSSFCSDGWRLCPGRKIAIRGPGPWARERCSMNVGAPVLVCYFVRGGSRAVRRLRRSEHLRGTTAGMGAGSSPSSVRGFAVGVPRWSYRPRAPVGRTVEKSTSRGDARILEERQCVKGDSGALARSSGHRRRRWRRGVDDCYTHLTCPRVGERKPGVS